MGMGLKLKPTGAMNSIDIEFEGGLCLRIYDHTGPSHNGTVSFQEITPEGNATGNFLGVEIDGSKQRQLQGKEAIIIRRLH